MRNRIIFIGLSKMGTTSLHKLLAHSGVRSAHWKLSNPQAFLAHKIFSNFSAGKPLLDGTEAYEAYSELSFVGKQVYLEGSILFRELHRDYPKSYFILNTRAKENWIKSRLNHFSKHGRLSDRSKRVLGISSDEDLIDLWSKFYDEHHNNVREFFQRSERFIEFDIEKDSPQKIADFLAPEYKIRTSEWGIHNSTEARNRRNRKGTV